MPIVEQRTVLVLAGIVYVLGLNILLPGIDASLLPAIMGEGNSIERLSLFGLGPIPLYSVLVLGELYRLIFSRSSRRKGSGNGLLTVKSVILPLIVLGLAALQGYGIANSLSAAGVVRDGAEGFAIGVVASFLGATALLIHLSDRIRIEGLRNGFWAVWSIPVLLALPKDIALSIEMTRTGTISFVPWAVSIGYIALSIAATAGVASLWRSVWRENDAASIPGAVCEPRDILVWPPVLAALLPGFIMVPVAILAADSIPLIQPYLPLVMIVSGALFIPVFVFGYVRLASSDNGTRSRLVAVGSVIALVQIAIFTAGRLLDMVIFLPVRLDGPTVIIMTVVVLGLVATPVATRTP